MTSFLVEFARGSKAAASARAAAHAATEAIDLSTTISNSLLALVGVLEAVTGQSNSVSLLAVYSQQPRRHPSRVYALCSHRPGTAYSLMLRCTKQEARYLRWPNVHPWQFLGGPDLPLRW